MVQARYNVARAYGSVQRFEEAEGLFLVAQKGRASLWKGAVERNLERLYKAWKKPEEAAKWESAVRANRLEKK